MSCTCSYVWFVITCNRQLRGNEVNESHVLVSDLHVLFIDAMNDVVSKLYHATPPRPRPHSSQVVLSRPPASHEYLHTTRSRVPFSGSTDADSPSRRREN